MPATAEPRFTLSLTRTELETLQMACLRAQAAWTDVACDDARSGREHRTAMALSDRNQSLRKRAEAALAVLSERGR